MTIFTKIETMTENDWSYDEFVCFLLIYISNADFNFSENEINKIVDQFSYDTFHKMNSIFEELNDFQCLNKIMGYKKLYFNDDKMISEVMNSVKFQFLVEGYSNLEKEVFMFLEKLFKTDGF
jgi:hypothetical protein